MGQAAYRSGDSARSLDYIPIKCDRSYRVQAWSVEVTVPKDLHPTRLHIPYRGMRRYRGKGRRAELLRDQGRGRWYMAYAVETLAATRREGVTAGIDLGLRILASLSVEGVEVALHFAGRGALKEWDYWNRRIARHQHELAHRQTKSSHRLRRLYAMHTARLRHLWDAMAKRIAQHCRRHGVGQVVIGWPQGILADVKANARWNGRLHGLWSFAQVTERICLALHRVGIPTEQVGERGTSSHCAQCGSVDVVRRPRHRLRCKACGVSMHSDQAGSRNMIRQKYPVHWDGAEAAPTPDTLRFDTHRWVDAYNPATPVVDPVAA